MECGGFPQSYDVCRMLCFFDGTVLEEEKDGLRVTTKIQQGVVIESPTMHSLDAVDGQEED